MTFSLSLVSVLFVFNLEREVVEVLNRSGGAEDILVIERSSIVTHIEHFSRLVKRLRVMRLHVLNSHRLAEVVLMMLLVHHVLLLLLLKQSLLVLVGGVELEGVAQLVI